MIQNAWILVVVTGVALQGFGRHVLARVYIKTEKLINEAESPDSARGSGDIQHRESQGIGGTENSEGGALSLDPHVQHSFSHKLNGVSSSIGKSCLSDKFCPENYCVVTSGVRPVKCSTNISQ